MTSQQDQIYTQENELLVKQYTKVEDTTRIQKLFLLEFSTPKTILMILLNIFALGLPYLIGRWQAQIAAKMYYKTISNIQQATNCLVIGLDGHREIVKLQHENLNYSNGGISNEQIKNIFQYRFLNYFYSEQTKMIEVIEFDLSKLSCHQISVDFGKKQKNQQEIQVLQRLYNKNLIQIDVKSPLKIFIDEVLSPFYIFQVYSFIIWILTEYLIFTYILIGMTLIGIGMTIYQIRSNLQRLKDMAQHESQVNVFRKGQNQEQIQRISTVELVPGDIFEIEENIIVPCDAILLNGECIINEAMLTGESIPVIKTGLPHSDIKYNSDEHKQYTLFCGTQCLQTRKFNDKYVLALVTQSGFYTQKGSLVRSILFPKKSQFKFERDSYKFIGAMGIFAIIVMIFTLYFQIEQNVETYWLVLRALQLITIAVPPSLPACMNGVTESTLQRLRSKQIYCIQSQKINVFGRAEILCFDKTGTLTEEGLDVLGIESISVDKQIYSFQEFNRDIPSLGNKLKQNEFPLNQYILEILASCHAIAKINDKLIGDPLDVKMFESTQWILKDIQNNNNNVKAIVQNNYTQDELSIIRRYEFASSLQRMSVITSNSSNNKYMLNVKGSPEKLIELCQPHTIPMNFKKILQEHTKKGYRVLALAQKELKEEVSKLDLVQREDLEIDLCFMGLLIMENKIKQITPSIIEQLKAAQLKCIMVTGDNILTAVNVAKNAQLINKNEKIYISELQGIDQDQRNIVWYDFDAMDQFNIEKQQQYNQNEQTFIDMRQNQENLSFPQVNSGEYVLALDGKTFSYILKKVKEEGNPEGVYYQYLTRILGKGSVYARMHPDEKAALINSLKDRGLVTSMCGDGANDCAALRAADIGVSLSDTEASIAAPFTSKVQDIQCIVYLLAEGRASLTTSFQIFKFIIFYSLTQCFMVAVMYHFGSDMTNWQYIYNDLVLSFILALAISRTKPNSTLSIQKPSASLLSFPVLLSLIGTLFFQFLMFFLMILFVKDQPFYILASELQTSDELGAESIAGCYENVVLFYTANFQLIASSLAFNVGKPFRKEFYQNYYFLVFILVFQGYNIWILVNPDSFSFDLFRLLELPNNFRLQLLLYLCIDTLFMLAYDYLFVRPFLRWLDNRKSLKNKQSTLLELHAI